MFFRLNFYLIVILRSQKTCRLQKDAGVYTSLSGLSLTVMASGPVLRFSTQPRRVQKTKRKVKLCGHLFILHGYITDSQYDQLLVGLIAQLVEHCTGIAEVMGSNPVQA